MERGDIKEAIECLDKADEVLRHKIRARVSLGELYACQKARENIQAAINALLPQEEGK